MYIITILWLLKYEDKSYAQFFAPDKLLIFDKKYQENYIRLDNLSNSKRVGPRIGRNFVCDYSISLWYQYYWVLNDKFRRFQRFNNNKKIPIKTAVIFDIMEEFTKRFSNIGML